ncbi:hypothetical protein ABTE26_21090, partial [Acinetobacter baumannii]
MALGYVHHTQGYTYESLYRSPTFFTDEVNLLRDGKLVKIDKPLESTVTAFGPNILIKLRTDWEVGGKKYKS